MWQDTRSIHKNQFYFYTFTMNDLKTKFEKTTTPLTILWSKRNKIFTKN